MKVKRGLVTIVGLSISATAVWLVLQIIDPGDVIQVLERANPVPLLAIVAVVALQVTLRAWRWSILLPGEHRVAVPRLLPPLLVGYLGNAILPARLGEPMRAIVVARRERVGAPEAFGSVVVERVVDASTLAPVAFVAALVLGAPAWTVQALGVAAAAGVLGIAVLLTVGVHPVIRLADRLGLGRRRLVSDLVARFGATLGGPSRRTAVGTAATISTVAWLLDATSFWLAGQAVGADVSYVGAMLIAGVTVLGTAIPSAPGYVGTFELAAAGVAGLLGVPGAEALAMAIVAHVMTLTPMALGGAASLTLMSAGLGEIARTAETSRHG